MMKNLKVWVATIGLVAMGMSSFAAAEIQCVADGSTGEYCGEGYGITVNVSTSAGEVAARIGSQTYMTLQGAFNAAVDGDVVVLLRYVAEDSVSIGDSKVRATATGPISLKATFTPGGAMKFFRVGVSDKW